MLMQLSMLCRPRGGGGGGGARDRVRTLIRNKHLGSNFLTLGIRFQFKVPHPGKRFRILSLESKLNEPKQCINTWQIAEVSNSAKRHADNSGNHTDL